MANEESYGVDPKSYGFERMDKGDYGNIERGIVESTLPFMQEREKRAGKRLSARNVAMGITDSPASVKLHSETVEQPYAREESALRSGAKVSALGFKERDIGRWNTVLGELTGREFSREERLGGQKFQTGEREAGQTWRTGEREAGQAHDIRMQDDAQTWQTTADELNRDLQRDLGQLNYFMEEGQYFNFDYDNPDYFGSDVTIPQTTPYLGYEPPVSETIDIGELKDMGLQGAFS